MDSKAFDLSDISPYLRLIHTDISVRGEDPYEIPWRCTYDYELIFLFGGELNVKTENDEYTLHSGDLHVMRPFMRHTRFKTPGSMIKLYSVHFDISKMGDEFDFDPMDIYSKPIEYKLKSVQNNQRLSDRPLFTIRNFEFPKKITVLEPMSYIEILNNALKIFEDKPFGYELDLKICLLQIIRLIITDMNTIHIQKHLSKSEKTLLKCVDFIKNNYNQKIDFEKLAVDNGFKPSYFRRLFKELTGKTPNDYMIDLRIKSAVEFLRTGIYPISKISSMVGYDNFHYFSRLFKIKKNVTPSDFLKKGIEYNQNR